MPDTSQYYKPAGSDTTYTSYDAYKQNIGGATPQSLEANTYSTTPPNQTTPVNTTQPNPNTVNATPATGASPTAPPPNLTAPVGNGTINPATGMLENPQQDAINKALQQAKASGPAPQASTDGMAGVGKFLPPPPPDTTNVDTALANDSGYQQLLADRNAYNAEAGTSLLDTYKQLETDAGLPALNEKLLNLDHIINGTEDDIRKEVQAANGFATESQILGLSNARNKQNIADYNKLLDTKKLAEDRINTMIGLSKDDKQIALSKLNEQMNFDQKMIDYRDKFISHATEGYNNVLKSVGYKGLSDMLQGDPTALATVEKSMGLYPGAIANLAKIEQNQSNLKGLEGVTTPYANVNGEIQDTKTGQGFASPEDFQKKTGMTLDQAGAKGLISKVGKAIDLKQYPASYQEFLLAQQDGYKGSYNDYQTMDANRKAVRSTTNNVTYNQSQDQQIQKDIQVTNNNLKGVIGKDGFVSPQDWKRAYSDWLGAGHKGADFISNFSQYVNPADPQDYGIKL